jgi:hypothetical protein
MRALAVGRTSSALELPRRGGRWRQPPYIRTSRVRVRHVSIPCVVDRDREVSVVVVYLMHGPYPYPATGETRVRRPHGRHARGAGVARAARRDVLPGLAQAQAQAQ